MSPPTAVGVQAICGRATFDRALAEYEGIFGMPSLHSAMVALMVLIGFKVNRVMGWCFVFYAFLIFLASIHIGWHYARDGYLAAVGAVALWHVSGRVLRWWDGFATRSMPA